jgi:putative tryptophan/tyrosine transport system substrate-binding protein
MRRRKFIKLVGGAAATWPLTARAAQPAGIRRVGVLMAVPESDTEAQSWIGVFQQRLRDLGWTGGHLRIDFRFPGTGTDGIRMQAAEFVRTAPDVILAHSPRAVSALLRETRTIPIVFVQVVDPVELSFVASLARPGGNVTGFTNFEFSMGGKWVEAIKEIAPHVSRALVLLEPANPAAAGFVREIEAAAARAKLLLTLAGVQEATEIESAVRDFAREPDGGLIALPSPITLLSRDQIIALAERSRLPAIYAFRYFPANGGLLSYGTSASEVFRQAASYVDRILKGERPADLPIQTPTKFELVINLKTAKALGLTVPPALLARADEVIE